MGQTAKLKKTTVMLKRIGKRFFYTRTKPKRKPLPKDLPSETCTCIGQKLFLLSAPLHRIGEGTSEKLEFLPAQLKVIKTVPHKYACRQ